ncbi:MAG: PHP domain-containing protein, partial [Planctomycetota bacterium]
MRTAALACRSYYSLLRGAVSVQRLARKAKEYGYGAVALTDVNSMYGVVDFWQQAAKADIKPIVGAEILTDTQSVVLLAEDRTGYKNLCRITTARNLDQNFSLIQQLTKYGRGLICICDQPELLKKLQAFFNADYLFAACRNAHQANRAKADGLKPVAYTTFNCLVREDMATAKLLARIRSLSVAGPGPEDERGFNKLVPEKQLRTNFLNCPEAVINAEQIAQRCNFQLLNGRYFLPKIDPAAANSDKKLGRLCHHGLAKRYRPLSKEVVKRLEYELAVIRKNRFSDYFLLVHEIINFAARNNIPVDVRGSAAGSLVSYVLGFTRVCPIESNLYFERFMNPGRRDCPDIDIDLCWRRRDEVISFCYENWGFDRVAMISNINRYRRRSAIRDVGRFLGLKPPQINGLVKRRKTNPDSAIYRLAERIIGFPRHLGVHCGGIVITPSPVRDIAPLEKATKGVIVTQYDKDAAEAVGLIKIDLLGNRALSTVDGTVNIISKPDSLDVDAFSPTDQKTANMLSAGDSLGVFQCESPGMRQLLRGLKVKTKKDVAIALS